VCVFAMSHDSKLYLHGQVVDKSRRCDLNRDLDVVHVYVCFPLASLGCSIGARVSTVCQVLKMSSFVLLVKTPNGLDAFAICLLSLSVQALRATREIDRN